MTDLQKKILKKIDEGVSMEDLRKFVVDYIPTSRTKGGIHNLSKVVAGIYPKKSNFFNPRFDHFFIADGKVFYAQNTFAIGVNATQEAIEAISNYKTMDYEDKIEDFYKDSILKIWEKFCVDEGKEKSISYKWFMLNKLDVEKHVKQYGITKTKFSPENAICIQGYLYNPYTLNRLLKLVPQKEVKATIWGVSNILHIIWEDGQFFMTGLRQTKAGRD